MLLEIKSFEGLFWYLAVYSWIFSEVTLSMKSEETCSINPNKTHHPYDSENPRRRKLKKHSERKSYFWQNSVNSQPWKKLTPACGYSDRFCLWKEKKSSNILISCISLIHLEREKDRLTTCRTLLIHWKLSSSEASGRCSATSTIRSSCKTGTENTAILKHKGQKNDRMQHRVNRAWLIITWEWLQPLMARFHTQALFMPDHHKITEKFRTHVGSLL